MERPGHQRLIEEAFTEQASTFNSSAVANADSILNAIVELAEPQPSERWLEAACGPGIISRRLAPLVNAVQGIDLTPAMIELARREAAVAELDNAVFEVGDATATGLQAAGFDGAVTRFSLHHLPVPARLFAELSRVVRPGGKVVIVDHVADDDAEARAWSQEIERLRDPSHWACLSETRLRALGEQAGLGLASAQRVAFELDFDDCFVEAHPTRSHKSSSSSPSTSGPAAPSRSAQGPTTPSHPDAAIVARGLAAAMTLDHGRRLQGGL